MVRRGCSVREVLERATELEEEARKALRSVPKIVFEHNKEGTEKAAVFGKVRTMLYSPQNVVATSKGWDKVALKWDTCCSCEEGKKCAYRVEVKKEEEDDSKYTEVYEGEEEGCTVSGLQSDTVYCFHVCVWLKGGPFLFCLAVHPVLKKLTRSVVPLAYMDDIYLVSDNVERLKEAVLALKDDLEKLNLKAYFSKCSEQSGKFQG